MWSASYAPDAASLAFVENTTAGGKRGDVAAFDDAIWTFGADGLWKFTPAHGWAQLQPTLDGGAGPFFV